MRVICLESEPSLSFVTILTFISNFKNVLDNDHIRHLIGGGDCDAK